MQSLKKILFFILQYAKMIRKKWLKLLLLFVFPFILLSLIITLLLSILLPSTKDPIVIGFIDEDQTEETQLFGMIVDSGEALDNSFIQMIEMTKLEAEKAMEQDEISLYFLFPEGFTASLYEGKSIDVTLIGNPTRPLDSFLVKELLDSLTRYIGTSQASILTVNDYAKELAIDKIEREEMLFANFIEFTMFVLGKGKLVNEKEIVNVSTESPLNYYLVAGWFIAFSIWLMGIYIMLETEQSKTMLVRFRMFGVTIGQQVIARLCVTLVTSIILAIVSFGFVQYVIQVTLFPVDYMRILLFVILYGIVVLQVFSLLSIIIASQKLKLLFQTALLLCIIILSGALIPTLYFPAGLQSFLPYVFSYGSFNWLIDLIVSERNYADYTEMIILVGLGFIVLAFASYGKERILKWGE